MPEGERGGAQAAQARSPAAAPASAIDARMVRLERLLGADEGFFVLALHSFVESFILDVYPAGRGGKYFPTLLWDFKDFLKQKGRITVADQEAIIRISKEHPTANRVRHQMQRLDPEEAVAASHNFLGFCRRARLTTRSSRACGTASRPGRRRSLLSKEARSWPG